MSEISRKEIEILRILSEASEPMGSTLIKRELERRGFFLSERTVRYHLQMLELKELVSEHEKGGRVITQKGLEELARALVSQRIGFVTTRFISMAYFVTYDPATDSGKVVANVSIIDKKFYDKAIDIVNSLYEANILLAPYIKVLDENEEYENISLSKGRIALFTVCDLTIDGILIHSGIPLFFKYGGLVQIINKKPIRFVELIAYDGTTIPPLELFVRSNQTSIMKVIKTGSGILPGAMREIVAEARERTVKIISILKEKGWGGILAISMPNEPTLGVPVSMDRFGLCMIGGLTPGAALLEEGINVETFAPHCLIPLEDMRKIC
ncbi:MAG: NrpR regulatory domain-containing protein [Candidatus Methanomethyliaceae archaeon]|nr:NrpR regulatory domain-containing protein [Candidatus Methanomethyliaceae archaeon]MDW7970578.1 NrpR regulatory domain-containing protein [Nitrososphaerota archaeon]